MGQHLLDHSRSEWEAEYSHTAWLMTLAEKWQLAWGDLATEALIPAICRTRVDTPSSRTSTVPILQPQVPDQSDTSLTNLRLFLA